MKKAIVLFMSLILMFSVTACGDKATPTPQAESKTKKACKHEFSDATCTEPATCTLCGETGSVALGHSFTNEKSCTEERVCERCGEKQAALGHDWIAATCEQAKQCSQCNATEGTIGEHRFVGTTCMVCGKENTKTLSLGNIKIIVPVSVELQNHSTSFKINVEKIDYNLNVWYSVECISRPDDYDLWFNYSLYDPDGYVIASKDTYTVNLNGGEKARDQSFKIYADTSTSLISGKTYTLKLTNSN